MSDISSKGSETQGIPTSTGSGGDATVAPLNLPVATFPYDTSVPASKPVNATQAFTYLGEEVVELKSKYLIEDNNFKVDTGSYNKYGYKEYQTWETKDNFWIVVKNTFNSTTLQYVLSFADMSNNSSIANLSTAKLAQDTLTYRNTL